MIKNFELIAKTYSGFEDLLANELRSLGAENINVLKRAIVFEGNNELLYKANLMSRTALRILKPIHKFKAKNLFQIYKNIQDVNLNELFELKGTLSLTTSINSPFFKTQNEVFNKFKDAIVDKYFKKLGIRPSFDIDNPALSMNLHIQNDNCTLSLDSSGSPLHKRGYVITNHEPIINEVLAAGFIMLSGWNGNSNFVNPLSWSGIFLIEAAMIAHNIPANINRKGFSFQYWKDYDPLLWKKILTQTSINQRPFKHEIFGSESTSENLINLRSNIRHAKLEDKISIKRCSLDKFDVPQKDGIMFMNPVYDYKMKEQDRQKYFESLNKKLKEFSGYPSFITSHNKEVFKIIESKPVRNYIFSIGQTELVLNEYKFLKDSPHKPLLEESQVNS